MGASLGFGCNASSDSDTSTTFVVFSSSESHIWCVLPESDIWEAQPDEGSSVHALLCVLMNRCKEFRRVCPWTCDRVLLSARMGNEYLNSHYRNPDQLECVCPAFLQYLASKLPTPASTCACHVVVSLNKVMI